MFKECRLCGEETCQKPFQAHFKQFKLNYYECANCDYVQTQYPTWLAKAYEKPINNSDTGIMARSISNVQLVITVLNLLHIKQGKVVDWAGGYGILVRMLRDHGIDALWSDLYSENLVAKGFEHRGEKANLITAFEAFEHFVNPCQEIESLLSIAPNILFTTNLIPSPAPLPSDWWYYGLEHGQHIGFFRVKSLMYIAKKYNLHLLTDSLSTHLLTSNKASKHMWRILRLLNKLHPKLLARGLFSKTWQDHLAASQCK